MANPVRVAVVVPEFRPEAAKRGGVDSVVHFVLRALSDRDSWDVRIVSLRMSRSAHESRRILSPGTWLRGIVESTSEHQGVPVHQVGASLAEIELTRYWPRRRLNELLNEADVVLAVGGSPAFAKSVAGCGLPVVGQFATFVASERRELIQTSSGMLKPVRRLLAALVARYDRQGIAACRTVLVENREMRRLCTSMGARDVRLAPPGVDTDWFESSASRARSGLLMVGRLDDPRKNIRLLVDAFSVLRETHGYSGRLVLAGSAAPSPDVLDRIEQLGLQQSIEIRLGLSDAELLGLYQSAELFVLSSSEEGLGLVILEALATGLPVVATATEGAKEILGGQEWADLVPLSTATPDHLASVIASRLKERRNEAPDDSPERRHVLDHYSDQATAERFREALTEAAAVGGNTAAWSNGAATGGWRGRQS